MNARFSQKGTINRKINLQIRVHLQALESLV